MFETLLRKWKKGSLTEEQLQKAVEYGWITQEQADYIKAQPHG